MILTVGGIILNNESSLRKQLLAAICVRTKSSDLSEAQRSGVIKIIEEELDRVVPEIDVVQSVRDLRRMASTDKVARKSKFTSRREVNPIEFMMQQYGNEIQEGKLSRGQLATIDPGLYVAVKDQLQTDAGMDIKTYFERQSGLPSHSINQKKIAACANILGTDWPKATRFFSNVRMSRIASERGSADFGANRC